MLFHQNMLSELKRKTVMDRIKYSLPQLHYFAWDLSHKKSCDDAGRFTNVLSEAKVDMNPHQVEAALFAFKSPLSKGAILADEVGLGKTIEAGIILSEFWAEHKRNIIIVVPASLRNQWCEELREKFFLPSVVLDSSNYDAFIKENGALADGNNIIICSYNFVVTHKEAISGNSWDLVVLDEAHKLRNVYKGNVIGSTIKELFAHNKKILLTATPLQNNLKELYGLISIIDGEFFSTIDTFNNQYNGVSTRDAVRFGELKSRLNTIVHRTLRRQVSEYVNFTRRTPFVQKYKSSDDENALYDAVTKYLFEDYCYSFNPIAWPMLSLIIRKVLSSSAYAISFTLQGLINRLEEYKQTGVMPNILNMIGSDFYVSEEYNLSTKQCDSNSVNEDVLENELASLHHCLSLAKRIKTESKASNLLLALKQVAEQNKKVGASGKALIFTESTRTQTYLKKYLSENGYNVVCFNGSNNDEDANNIYRRWKLANLGRDNITGSKAVDVKQALVDYFKNEADIMIATESGAEGINLQFCSVVVNYDMPWNPQRIEQRIGRCHRYGQKNDVVVVNFVNQQNYADCRVYELLSDKFSLFEGVFGSSDEVLGSIDSGFDIEKKINAIYRSCRTEREISAAFDQLQTELDSLIKERIKQTQKSLLENFDGDVVNKLKIRQGNDVIRINNYTRHFWSIAKDALRDFADAFCEDELSFYLHTAPIDGIETGRYILNKENGDYHQLRTSHPLGQFIISQYNGSELTDSEVVFDIERTPIRHKIVEKYIGQNGLLIANIITSDNAYDYCEDIIFSVVTDNGEVLPDDFGMKLMELPCKIYRETDLSLFHASNIKELISTQYSAFVNKTEKNTGIFINAEIDKFQAWAEDQTFNLNNEVILLRKEGDSIKRQLRKETNHQVRLELLDSSNRIEKEYKTKQRRLFSLQDEYEQKVDELVDKLKKKMKSNYLIKPFFKIRWSIVCSSNN